MGTNVDFLQIKKKKKRTFPNQFICEEKANGIICNGNFYPWKITKSDLNAKKGIAYFLKSYWISVAKAGIGAALAYSSPTVTIGGLLKDLGYCKIEETFVASGANAQIFIVVNLLCDKETTIYNGDGFYLQYTEVDSLPGELNPKVIEDED
jgi:hypothetical protein